MDSGTPDPTAGAGRGELVSVPATKPSHDLAPIVWLRQDLRFADNRAPIAACESGGPVIPVYALPIVEHTAARARAPAACQDTERAALQT